MSNKSIIQALREAIKTDKVLADVLHMFAQRERTRFILTVPGLTQRMQKEKFEHSKEEYAKVLEVMGSMGLGKIVHDSKGRVLALKEIKITLQSLGKAVYEKGEKALQNYKQRNQFQKVAAAPQVDHQVPGAVLKPGLRTAVVLTFIKDNGKAVNLRVPNDMEADDIGYIVTRLQGRGA